MAIFGFPLVEILLGGLLFLLGFLSREIFPWLLREWHRQREERRKWYDRVSGIASQTHTVAKRVGKDRMYPKQANELDQLEKKLIKEKNQSVGVDPSFLAELEDLHVKLDYFNSSHFSNTVIEDDSAWGTDMMDDSTKEALDDIRQTAINIRNTAKDRSNEEYNILGFRF